MSVVKVIELISEGKTIEAAVQAAVDEASKTLHNIKQVNVEHIGAVIEKNKVTQYRINSKVSFVIDEKR
jgi:dodecin